MRDVPVREALAERARRSVLLAAAREGLQYVFTHPVIRSTMLLDFLGDVLCVRNGPCWPIFAQDILHVGARGYGLPRSAGSRRTPGDRGHAPPDQASGSVQGRLLMWAVTVYGLVTVVFGFSKTLWLTFLCLAISGAADAVSAMVRNLVRQLETPDTIRGRMIGVNMVFFLGGPQLGELEAGLVASVRRAVVGHHRRRRLPCRDRIAGVADAATAPLPPAARRPLGNPGVIRAIWCGDWWRNGLSIVAPGRSDRRTPSSHAALRPEHDIEAKDGGAKRLGPGEPEEVRAPQRAHRILDDAPGLASSVIRLPLTSSAKRRGVPASATNASVRVRIRVRAGQVPDRHLGSDLRRWRPWVPNREAAKEGNQRAAVRLKAEAQFVFPGRIEQVRPRVEVLPVGLDIRQSLGRATRDDGDMVSRQAHRAAAATDIERVRMASTPRIER